MIGRDAELEQVRDSLRRLSAGIGGIVSLIGRAGIGKSRLVAEALATEEAHRSKLLVGRSLSVGQSLSFHPFSDLLRGWAGIAGGADDAEALDLLEGAVRAACGDATGEIVPFIASMMGLRPTEAHARRLDGIEGQPLERLIFKSMRELFQRLASVQPLVVFFEDVHWADHSSVQLLEQLLRLVGESPILFVHALRPEHVDTGQRLLAVARTQYPLQHRQIELKPLDAAQCGELVRELLRSDDLPAAALGSIAEHAEGSPLFVEEMLRSLLDQGIVEQRDGALHVRGSLSAIAVPGSVREVIESRLARLDGESRRLLDAAAAIGRSFFGRIIAAVLRDDSGLEERLQALEERGLLLERRTRRTAAHARRTFAAEVEYVFQHALVQETIYGAIPAEQRRELHARIGATIESLYADRLTDFHGMLAYHYVRAENLEKAEEYLFKAGEEAARAAASSEALTFFREASAVYLRRHGDGGDAAKKALLERNIGLALMNTGQLAESMPHFDRALAHLGTPAPATAPGALAQFAVDVVAVAARLVLPRAVFRATAGQTRHAEDLKIRYARIKAQSTSDPKRLLFDYFRAIRLLNRTDPAAVPDQVIGLYSGFAAMFAYSGVSFSIGRRYLALADRLRRPGHAKDQFDHDSLVCICNYLEGKWDDDDGTVPDGVVSAALRHGGPWEVNTYLGLDADRRLRRGDFAGARQRIEQLGDIAETYGFEFARGNGTGETMLLLLEQRRLEAALDAANLYHAMVQDDSLRVLALGSKAKAQVLLADREGAARSLRSAEEILRRAAIIPPWHLSSYAVGRLLHDVAALEGADTATRERASTQARTSARAAQSVAAKVAVQRGEIYRLSATVLHLLGESAEAARGLARAIVECERLGALPELARAHLDAAMWKADLGDGRDAAAHLARARELGLVGAGEAARRAA